MLQNAVSDSAVPIKSSPQSIGSTLESFEKELFPLRKQLMEHPLFDRIQTITGMSFFMENHVFAVWDFMSLLKTLQLQLTSTSVPWLPPKNRDAARFINEIVTGEESDEISPGKYISHFELYLEAMQEAGANLLQINSFTTALVAGCDYEKALSIAGAPQYVCLFVRTTMKFCTLQPHEVAAAFLYGREDIVPEMFTRILANSTLSERSQLLKLRRYLERHIEIDGESHGPMSKKLMQSLCANDSVKWKGAMLVAQSALRARHQLWDGILAAIQ